MKDLYFYLIIGVLLYIVIKNIIETKENYYYSTNNSHQWWSEGGNSGTKLMELDKDGKLTIGANSPRTNGFKWELDQSFPDDYACLRPITAPGTDKGQFCFHSQGGNMTVFPFGKLHIQGGDPKICLKDNTDTDPTCITYRQWKNLANLFKDEPNTNDSGMSLNGKFYIKAKTSPDTAFKCFLPNAAGTALTNCQ
jgi:hypothetical protein